MAGCKLPPGFTIGIASSAYQIEGAARQDGKGESCLDRHSRVLPNWNEDSSNGDVACDSYNRVQEDVALLRDLGVDFYRFSISWSRVAPTGDVLAGTNRAGLDHYRNFITSLVKANIKPMVTMFHWDMPQPLQDLGGWSNSVVIPYFVEYARLLFQEYGDLVKDWYTVNEPQLVGLFGYGGGTLDEPPYPPGVISPGIGDYLAQHHQLIAHARVYRMYQQEFKEVQKGKVGIVCQMFWVEPKSDRQEDVEATRRSLLFEIDAMIHPLVKGDYPPELRRIIDTNSADEGRTVSRLPVFTPEEVELVKGSFDYIGINEYSTFSVSNEIPEAAKRPSQAYDNAVLKESPPNATIPGVSWLTHDPEGIRKSLNYLRKEYGKFPIYISENGCDDPSGLHDKYRIQYLKGYLRNVVAAVSDGCDVLGYTIWSFLDSFEWAGGYTMKFGMYHVDFKSKERKRTPKDSVKVLKEILKTRIIPD